MKTSFDMGLTPIERVSQLESIVHDALNLENQGTLAASKAIDGLYNQVKKVIIGRSI